MGRRTAAARSMILPSTKVCVRGRAQGNNGAVVVDDDVVVVGFIGVVFVRVVCQSMEVEDVKFV